VTYTSYAELAAAETEGVDYERRSDVPTGATWAAIAIHGGGIEPGTGEVAAAVAGSDWAYYEFAGIKPSGNSALHIESDLFDEPICVALVAASTRTVAIHGMTGDAGVPAVAIGGLDDELADRIRHNLVQQGFTIATAGAEIAGTNPANICNENASGAGVQLELSYALRQSFFPGGDLSRESRESGIHTAAFDAFVLAVRSAYEGLGLVAVSAVNSSRYTLITAPGADVDLVATVATDVVAAGGSIYAALVARYADTSNSYLARVEFTTGGALNLTIRKRVGGAESAIGGTYSTGLTYAAGTRVWARFQLSGTTLRAMVWLVGGSKPTVWQIEQTDSDLATAGSVGTRTILSVSNSNSLPVTVSWGQFRDLAYPQVWTATRSVNGVTKAIPDGSSVQLAAGPVRAL